jgi:hypothetical protein
MTFLFPPYSKSGVSILTVLNKQLHKNNLGNICFQMVPSVFSASLCEFVGAQGVQMRQYAHSHLRYICLLNKT